MKFRLTILTGILLIVSGVYGQNLHLDKIDDYITLIEKNNRGIGNLTIYRHGKELYNRNFGQASLPEPAYGSDTKYHIGSITKTYTAVLIFQLIEQKRLTLEDRLERFFPEMPGAKEITIKQMLEHTSGLGDYVIGDGDPDWLLEEVTEQDILNEIKRQGLVAAPGTKEEYSNSAYYLLAKIAEKIHNKDFGNLVHDYISAPYGLKNTASLLKKPEKVGKSYEYNADGWQEKKDFYFPNTKGAGDIVATTEDMLRFINALFEYRILTKESIAIMKPVIEKKEYFGRGLMQIPLYNHRFYGHGGDTRGTHSVLGYNEEDGVSLALVINGERYTRNQFILGVLSLMYEKPFEMPDFTEYKVVPGLLSQYDGTYSSPGFPLKVTISHDGETLYAQGTGQPSFALESAGLHKFSMEEAGLQLEFKPESQVMILKQGGSKFELIKEQPSK